MSDSCNPLSGWDPMEVLDTSSGAATADIYGKLFYYVRGLFRAFLGRLSSLDISFQMLQLSAIDLPVLLQGETFSRIEVRGAFAPCAQVNSPSDANGPPPHQPCRCPTFPTSGGWEYTVR